MSGQHADCIVLTGPGRGAVASISIEGGNVLTILRSLLVSRHTADDFVPGRVLYGRWQSAVGEDVVVGCLAADRFEIHCHGGVAAVEKIRESLKAAGCRFHDWRTGKTSSDSIDGEQRRRNEALLRVPSAATERTARILLDQLNGASVRQEIEQAIRWLDAGDQSAVKEVLAQLLIRNSIARHLDQPFKVAIAGPPNVGKSSLFNAILGYGRSIVFNQPGTTRDIVTANTAVDGWAFEIADTAGLRDTVDEVEAVGVLKAEQQIDEAELVLAVVDGTQPANDRLLAQLHRKRAIVVANKSDLPEFNLGRFLSASAVSCRTGQGIQALLARLISVLVPIDVTPGMGFPTYHEGRHLLCAAAALLAGDVAGCREELQRCLDGAGE